MVDLPGKPKPPKFTDDAEVRLFRSFLLDLRHAGHLRLNDLFGFYPEVHGAYNVYLHREDDTRYYLEARILARETDDQIAEGLGMLPGAIHYYERLFYNVRDRINCRDWILRQILGPAALRSHQGKSEEIVCKLFAYFGGPIALSIVMSGFSNWKHLTSCRKSSAYFDEQFIASMNRKAAIIAHTFVGSDYNAVEILTLRAKLMEVMKISERNGTASTDTEAAEIQKSIGSFFSSAKWHVGAPAEGEETADALSEVYTSAAEPRSNELMLKGPDRKKLVDKLKATKIPLPQVIDVETKQAQ